MSAARERSTRRADDAHTTVGSSPRRGRPRSTRVDDAIRAATVELLGESGYGSMTVDAVATRASVSRNAVYRRWSSKPDLVFDAVFPADAETHFPDTGTLASDLREVLVLFAQDFRRPEAKAAVGGLIADAQTDEGLRRRFRDRLEPIAQSAFRDIFQRAVRRGELAAVPQPDSALHLLIGAALYRALVVDDQPEPLADVLEALMSVPPTAGPRGRVTRRRNSR